MTAKKKKMMRRVFSPGEHRKQKEAVHAPKTIIENNQRHTCIYVLHKRCSLVFYVQSYKNARHYSFLFVKLHHFK